MAVFKVTLEPHELLLLDGSCSDKVQQEVDLVKHAIELCGRWQFDLNAGIFVAQAIGEANKSGSLAFKITGMFYCSVTGRRADYAPARRATRANPYPEQQQIAFSGYSLSASKVVVINYPTLAVSTEGFAIVQPALTHELKGVKAQIPEGITGYPSAWRNESVYKHLECGWEGRKSLLETTQPFKHGSSCPCCEKHGGEFGSIFSPTGRNKLVSLVQLQAEKEERAQTKQAAENDLREELRKQNSFSP